MLSVSRVRGSSDIQGRPANPPHRAGRARQSARQARDRCGRPIPTATAPPAPEPVITSSAVGVVFAVCSCTAATLSWRRGDGHTGPVGVWGTILVSGAPENKERKIPKTKGAAWAITGLGHGLINWCCEWRCPLQSFGLKKRTSDVCFTPESRHSGGSRKSSANDP